MTGSLLIKKGGWTIPHLFREEAEQWSPSDASPVPPWDCWEVGEHFPLNFWDLFMQVLVCDVDAPPFTQTCSDRIFPSKSQQGQLFPVSS